MRAYGRREGGTRGEGRWREDGSCSGQVLSANWDGGSIVNSCRWALMHIHH